MISQTTYTVLSVLLSIAYAGLLFWLAQGKKTRKWFLLLTVVPVVLLGIVLLVSAFVAGTISYWLLFLILLAERICWLVALDDSAGEDKLVWFYVIFFLPLFGWLLYRITKLR